MYDFTFSDFEKLAKKEEEFLHLFHLQEEAGKAVLKKQTIANVLAYSKTYDVQHSKHLNYIEYLKN